MSLFFVINIHSYEVNFRETIHIEFLLFQFVFSELQQLIVQEVSKIDIITYKNGKNFRKKLITTYLYICIDSLISRCKEKGLYKQQIRVL